MGAIVTWVLSWVWYGLERISNALHKVVQITIGKIMTTVVVTRRSPSAMRQLRSVTISRRVASPRPITWPWTIRTSKVAPRALTLLICDHFFLQLLWQIALALIFTARRCLPLCLLLMNLYGWYIKVKTSELYDGTEQSARTSPPSGCQCSSRRLLPFVKNTWLLVSWIYRSGLDIELGSPKNASMRRGNH